MLRTPWGDAEALRERRLPPGRSSDREAARQAQRERLFAAMVASCATRGFKATSVENLLRAAGVSRATSTSTSTARRAPCGRRSTRAAPR